MDPQELPAGLDRRSFLRGAARLGLGLLAWPGTRTFSSPAAAAGETRPSRLLVAGTVTGTGPLAAFGHAIRRGLLLWRDSAASGSAPGTPAFVLELAEDTGDPESALRHAAAAAGRAHVFVGPYGSKLAAAVLPLCRREGIPLLLPGAADPALDLSGPAGSPPIGFSLLPSNDQALTGAVEWAASRGARSIALLFREDPFILRAAEGACRRAQELNLTVAWDVIFTSAQQIWEASFELFGYGGSGPDAGGPGASGPGTGGRGSSPAAVDLLLGGGFLAGTEAQGFLRDAREITLAFSGKVGHLALLVAPTFDAFRQALGARAEGVLGNTLWKPGFTTPGNAPFVEAFRERWGEEPDAHGAAAYAAGQIIEAAAQRIDETGALVATGAGDRATERLTLRQALAALCTSTVFDPFSVDERGRQRAHAYSILQWKDGRLERVWPPPGRTGDAGRGPVPFGAGPSRADTPSPDPSELPPGG